MVCTGQLDLASAQKAIAADWISAYKRYEGPNPVRVRAIAMRQIEKIRQEDTTLHLDFADGSTMQISLAGPTSSVMGRDKDGKLEYTDCLPPALILGTEHLSVADSSLRHTPRCVTPRTTQERINYGN